jgi:hypothetical protein
MTPLLGIIILIGLLIDALTTPEPDQRVRRLLIVGAMGLIVLILRLAR